MQLLKIKKKKKKNMACVAESTPALLSLGRQFSGL